MKTAVEEHREETRPRARAPEGLGAPISNEVGDGIVVPHGRRDLMGHRVSKAEAQAPCGCGECGGSSRTPRTNASEGAPASSSGLTSSTSSTSSERVRRSKPIARRNIDNRAGPRTA